MLYQVHDGSKPLMETTIYSVGHSNYLVEKLLGLLRLHEIKIVYDIRSVPYSEHVPQFNREFLISTLQTNNIRYEYLGTELGARPADPHCYRNGRVHFATLAKTSMFRNGLEKLINGAQRDRAVMLCVEKDPLECPRSILLARELQTAATPVMHILEDGSIESHDESMDRLLEKLGMDRGSLFQTKEELISDACIKQEESVAYQKKN